MHAPFARVRRILGLSLAALVIALALMPALAPAAGAQRQEASANLAVDSDRDGLTDQVERRRGTNPADPDSDDDRLRDGAEVNTHRTDPLKRDTDRDRLKDGVEVNRYGTDPRDADTDDDGTKDGEEVARGTDPRVADERPDRDGDGLFDDDETDVYGTNPDVFDTDGDGVGDGEEVFLGTDPRVPNDDDGLDENCLDAEEAAVLTRINQLRATRGAAPVRVSRTLTAAAEAHSQDMGARNFTAHTNPDGKTEIDRIIAHGYQLGNPWKLGENIAWGNESGATTFGQWERSAPHFANMVDPAFEAIGIARVFVPGSTHGWYWTTTHANRFDAAPAC